MEKEMFLSKRLKELVMGSQGNQHVNEVYSWEPSSLCSPGCQEAMTVGWDLRLLDTGDKFPLEEGGMNWTVTVMGYNGRVLECKSLFSADILCLCGEVENFQEIWFFFPPKKFVLGEVSWATAQVLRLGGYAGGTRNQAFIVCLSGGARAGGLLSVYIWRGFHAESHVNRSLLLNITSCNLLCENKVYFGQDFLWKKMR